MSFKQYVTEKLLFWNMIRGTEKSFVKVDVITISQELQVKESFANAEVVVAGLCNIYTHYITTYEEYQVCMLENT